MSMLVFNRIISPKTLFNLFMTAGLLFIQSCSTTDDTSDADPREKFSGIWKVREESASGVQNYSSSVTLDPNNTSKIIIGNIYNVNASVKAAVAGNLIYLDETYVSNFLISGSGAYSGGGFVLNCKAVDGEQQSFKAIYTR